MTSGDGCVAASDEAGMPVHMDATWRNEAHKPMYDSVIFADSKSHKACNKERDTWYQITKSNACLFGYHDMSGPVWEKMMVNACDETTSNFNVVIASYSDSACTNMIDSDTHTSPEWCMFDLDEFDYGLMDMNYGSMLYNSEYCHKEPITPP
jgi:hypothetical protein